MILFPPENTLEEVPRLWSCNEIGALEFHGNSISEGFSSSLQPKPLPLIVSKFRLIYDSWINETEHSESNQSYPHLNPVPHKYRHTVLSVKLLITAVVTAEVNY